MKIKSNTLAILVIIILFGGIFASFTMNMWKTECNSKGERNLNISKDGNTNIGVGQEEHDEEYAIVKGKTTFKDVIDWGVSEEKIEEIIESSIPNSAMRIKDYCIENNLDFHTVKEVLQEEVDKTND